MKISSANVYASLYDGEFQVGYDCAGVDTCRFALCSTMPPDGNEECFFRRDGSCTSPIAQQAALESLRSRIKGELKKHKTNEDGETEAE
jgi:hypothetical protein